MNGNKEILLVTLDTNGRKFTIHDLAEFTWDFAHLLNFTPKEYDYHIYGDNAYTLTRFLAESHITLDTYPESNVMEVSLTSCKEIIPDIIQSDAIPNFGGRIAQFVQDRGLRIKNWSLLQKVYNNSWFPASVGEKC